MAGHDDLSDDTLLSGSSAAYLESLQARYEANPQSVDVDWRQFFRQACR